ncbi:nuclear transcription factor Y subunit B-3-like [Rhododendron vialii]|uniref:nuclear transcription factor Y subunit B-3-like n=1 Tax=Rhododendron vialii TaxID=182163 RepID=UPI00265F68E1|nr:nuclear transcription factor Y subunit B-3-like [Rhododendron vialii]
MEQGKGSQSGHRNPRSNSVAGIWALQMEVSCDCAVSLSHVQLVLPHRLNTPICVSFASQSLSLHFSSGLVLCVVNPVEQQQQQQSYTAPENTHDQDYYVPTANITRVMRRVLPPQAKIADDAKETVQQCVTEYINMITSEANDRCHREGRKTITADDILWAIERLGFDNYAGPLSLFLDRFRDAQRQWSEESRERLGSRVAHSRRLPPPTYGLLPPQGDGSGISSDNAGAGSSSSTSQGGAASFGPYAQFKR